jgi:peptidoglycan/xylan/chitin deacetylase (PgdA/CDA1 family)
MLKIMDDSLPVLMYHAVHPESSLISISPTIFQWQMNWLFENEYHVIGLDGLASALHERTPLPERSVILTFDDGYECLYEYALPVLARYGFPATIFLVAGHCGRMNDWAGQPANIPKLPILSWDQAVEMSRQGLEFGSHSMLHSRLDQIDSEKITYEIRESKRLIEDKLKRPVMSFAYPYGRFNDRVYSLVQDEYSFACSTRLGLVVPGSDRWKLERADIHYLSLPSLFSGLSQAWFPLYLGVRRTGRLFGSRVLGREWT